MENDKLQEILRKHKEWLDSNYQKGQRANLSRANLSGADLSGAYLSGADLQNTEIIIFCLSKHFGFAHFGEQYSENSLIQVGCENHSLEFWLENYRKIGLENNYTEKGIQMYGAQLKMLYDIKDLAK